MKEEISLKKFTTVVLGSLPESYDNFLTSLNARKVDDLDWENVKGLLIKEFLKRAEKSEKQEANKALYVKRESFDRGRYQARGGTGHGRGSRFWKKDTCTRARHDDHGNLNGVTCFKCKRDGHMVKNCPLNNKPNTGRKESSNMAELKGVALISSMMNRSDEWFIDSAATKHMTNNRSILENFVEHQQPKNFYHGDSTVIHALGEGKVRLPTVNSSHEVIHDVVLD